MAKLDTVLLFVALCSTWDRLNGTLFRAQDQKNFNLVVEKGSISWRLRRHGVDEVMTKLGTANFFVPLCST